MDCCDSSEAFIETFHFSTSGVFTPTNNALVELLKMTQIQVCNSMTFNDYNEHDIKCTNLIYFEYILDVSDKFVY